MSDVFSRIAALDAAYGRVNLRKTFEDRWKAAAPAASTGLWSVPQGELASVRISVLADGRVEISSTCADVPDSSYMPMPDERAPAEIAKLLAELRQRLK